MGAALSGKQSSPEAQENIPGGTKSECARRISVDQSQLALSGFCSAKPRFGETRRALTAHWPLNTTYAHQLSPGQGTQRQFADFVKSD
jgi:hypothetical protein